MKVKQLLAMQLHIGDIPILLYGPFVVLVGAGWPWWAHLLADTTFAGFAFGSWIGARSEGTG